MMKMPDLQTFIAEHGGYANVTPEQWEEWDRLNDAWRAECRGRLEMDRVFPALEGPSKRVRCEVCGELARFGYRAIDDRLKWYCTVHRLAEHWADARAM